MYECLHVCMYMCVCVIVYIYVCVCVWCICVCVIAVPDDFASSTNRDVLSLI